MADRFEVPLFRIKIREDAKFGEAHLVGLPAGIPPRGPDQLLRTATSRTN